MIRTSICLAGLLAGAPAMAQNPKAEVLPMPRPAVEVLPPAIAVVEMGPLGPARPGYFLPDPYAHWQLWAIDQNGFYKPRVILAPQPYYLYNGMPYRNLPTRPRDLSNYPTPR